MRVLFLILFCMVSPVMAQQQQVIPVQTAIALTVRAGDFDAARTILEQAGGNDLDRAFLEVSILQRQSRHAEAVAVLRAILRARPELSFFRRMLIDSLVAIGDIDGALFQIDDLSERSQDRAEREALSRLRSAVLARRPYGFTFGGSIVPSNNINRATANTEAPALGGLSGTIEETRESGLGATVSFGAYRRIPLSASQTLQFDGNLSLTAFSNPDYNRGSLSGGLSWLQSDVTGSWRLSATGVVTRYNDEADDNRRFILGLSRSQRLNDSRILIAGLNAYRTDFDAPANAIFDSYTLDASLGIRQRLTPRLIGEVGIGLGRTWAEDDRFSYYAYRVNGSLTRSWQSGWQVSLGASLERRPFDEIFSGLIPQRREDNTIGLNFSLLNSTITFRGATPRLRCSASKTSSNIVFYDNREVLECDFGLTTRF